MNSMTIEELSCCYKETARIIQQIQTEISLARTSESEVERDKIIEYQETLKEYSKYLKDLDNAIRSKIRELCGEN